jgi:hypothetical protein
LVIAATLTYTDSSTPGKLDARKLGGKTILTDESVGKLAAELPKADCMGVGNTVRQPRNQCSQNGESAQRQKPMDALGFRSAFSAASKRSIKLNKKNDVT